MGLPWGKLGYFGSKAILDGIMPLVRACFSCCRLIVDFRIQVSGKLFEEWHECPFVGVVVVFENIV